MFLIIYTTIVSTLIVTSIQDSLRQGSAYSLHQGSAYKYNVTDETKLIDTILAGYNPASRPVYNASHTVTVKFGITLTQISDMDEVNQVLTMNVWLEQEWEDERLIWDPRDYNNLKILRLPCELLWLPDIVLYNSADDFTNGYMNSKAMVHHNGTVFWPPPARFRSSCKIDITYFPFDDQSCELKFGSWTYDGFQVDVTNRTPSVDLQNYVYSGEWELIDVRINRTVVTYACCIEPYPDVRFTVVIRRKTLYYLFNIIFPCLWLTILSLLGFWLPPDSGEKITLGITVLLAFSVFMLLIAESMPATSEFVPLMGIYLTVTMGMTSMSIILTVFVLQLHHVGPHKRPVPGWLHTIVVGVFARLVCMSRDSQTFKQHRLAPSGAATTKGQTVTVQVQPGPAVASRENRHLRRFSGDTRRLDSRFGDDQRGGQYRERRDHQAVCVDPYTPASCRDSRDKFRETVGQNVRSQDAPSLPRLRTNCNGDGSVQQVNQTASAIPPTGFAVQRIEDQGACKSSLTPYSQSNRGLSTISTPAYQSSDANRLHSGTSQHLLGDSFYYAQAQEISQRSPRHSFMQAGLTPQIDCMEGPVLERYQQLVLEWQFVAHVMDRLLFWLFLVLAIACSLAILVIKPLFKPAL